MGIEKQFGDELNRLEQELARLEPKAGQLDHGQLMYMAGRESAAAESARSAPRAWLWPTATSVMTVVAAACAALWLMPREPLVVEKIVYVNQPVEKKTVDDSPTNRIVNVVDPPPRTSPAKLRDIWNIDERRHVPEENYLHVRQIALARGVDQLPTVAFGGSGVDAPKSYRELRQSLLGRQIDRLEESRDVQPNPTPIEFEQGDNT